MTETDKHKMKIKHETQAHKKGEWGNTKTKIILRNFYSFIFFFSTCSACGFAHQNQKEITLS